MHSSTSTAKCHCDEFPKIAIFRNHTSIYTLKLIAYYAISLKKVLQEHNVVPHQLNNYLNLFT